ncbi:4535_t:CDS:2, partial [Scutellospora calospora]
STREGIVHCNNFEKEEGRLYKIRNVFKDNIGKTKCNLCYRFHYYKILRIDDSNCAIPFCGKRVDSEDDDEYYDEDRQCFYVVQKMI